MSHLEALLKLSPVVIDGEYVNSLTADATVLDTAFNDCIAVNHEIFVNTATELLSAWERIYQVASDTDIAVRRQNMLKALRAYGGLNIGYFYGIAQALGYTIGVAGSADPHLRIADGVYSPFRVGISVIGDEIYDQDGAYSIHHFIVYGTSVETDTVLQATINELKPAWTTVEYVNE